MWMCLKMVPNAHKNRSNKTENDEQPIDGFKIFRLALFPNPYFKC